MTDQPNPSDPRIDDVLQGLRAGVRQRRAEAATLPEGEATRGGLLALKTHEYVREPIAFSHRPSFGKVIVFARKAFFHLFLKWFTRPVMEQQNAFNQTSSRLIQDLVEAHERATREARQLAARVEELEQRLAAQERDDRTKGPGR
jgi:hypothetical protein